MELSPPTPERGELLVRVSAAGVNPYDLKIAEGALDGVMPHRFPLVLGIDGAGKVAAVGPGVTRFSVGDRVFGQFLHAPVGTGTYCELTTVPETIGVSKIPPRLGDAEAAALPTAGMTALYAIESLGLAKGENLFIVGASGGVGSFAVQLAASRGIRVVAVARGASVDYVRGLGALEVLPRELPDSLDRIRSGHPSGVDALLDLASDARRIGTFARLVRDGGVVASTTGAAPAEGPSGRSVRTLNVNLTASSSLLDRLLNEVAQGHVRVPIGSTLPLAEASVAWESIRSGASQGKTVLRI